MIVPLMAGYSSNLAKMFSPTEQFPQHILPLLPIYKAQWWGYESLTVTVLVIYTLGYVICKYNVCYYRVLFKLEGRVSRI